MLATGLGIKACQAGHRVLFATAAAWTDKLTTAHRTGRLQQEITRLGRYPLLVIDEIGYIPFEPEAASLFFQVRISARYETASVIVTSNKPFSSWGSCSYLAHLRAPTPTAVGQRLTLRRPSGRLLRHDGGTESPAQPERLPHNENS